MKIVREEVATKAAVRLLVSGLGLRKCGWFHDRKLTQYDDWAKQFGSEVILHREACKAPLCFG